MGILPQQKEILIRDNFLLWQKPRWPSQNSQTEMRQVYSETSREKGGQVMAPAVMTSRQAAEFDYALERNQMTPELVKKMSEGEFLAQVRDVLEGRAEIRLIEHLINCDVGPFIPEGWEVEEHQKGGQFRWDSAGVELYLSKLQWKGKSISGYELRKDLVGKPVMNACVLDYLLANQHLIPEEWKGKAVFFWGTIYRRSDGFLYVRCLYWLGSRWFWGCRWLGYGWFADYPVALRAK